MLTISKPMSAAQASSYHAEQFTNATENYYTEGDQVRGHWHGQLAAEWGLTGEVEQDAFNHLAAGQHPETGEQLVRYQQAREYLNDDGQVIRTMEHRAGWDATFSAPKSVSLTALVGGDERVREAHRDSVNVALEETEHYVQARIGGNAPAVTTGKWAVAAFEHDSARPVDGYAAPQLHTHAVFFNITETEDGKAHAIQPQELYRGQQYATAVYRSELAWRLQELGYTIDVAKNGAPEIRGYSPEYLEASSPRSQQIKEHLAEQGVSGAGAAQIAAHRTRDAKLTLTREEMLARHQEMAESFGNQPRHVLEAAKEKTAIEHAEYRDGRTKPAQSAVTFARDRNLEREAVLDERALMRDALKRSIGQAKLEDVKIQVQERIERGELIEMKTEIGRSFTTPEMIALERGNIERMKSGQGRYAPIAEQQPIRFEHLSNSQQQAVETILASRDQIAGLEGAAGAGKTTSLAAIREAAEKSGYTVEGFAPTSRAAYQLEEAGIPATTLQHHLAQSRHAGMEGKHLYFVDESSLASTQQVHDFFERLNEKDRVVFVGDVRQHQAVDAGRPYEQLQQAGMQTARLDEIVRQKDPALRETVEQLSRGEVREAVARLNDQGRVHEVQDRGERIAEIASAYAGQPEGTLVISPDNASRMELNRAIHGAMQERGAVGTEEHTMKVLTPRQDMTGVDRAWASQYETGDVVRYAKGSRTLGIEPGEYATVREIDRDRNQLTIERESGETLTYDPRRLQGVAVYRESERAFSDGDRVQFTAPDRERKIANREMGTIENIDESGNLQIKLDSGRELSLNIEDHPHLDYGYAVTSHSSQGATADRVLIHIDSEAAHAQLINSRLAYVAVSRARYDAQIYTNDADTLGKVLSREVSHAAAVEGIAEEAIQAGMEGASESQGQLPAAAEGQGEAMAMEH